MGTLITPAKGYRTGRRAGRPLAARQQLAVIALVYGVYLLIRAVGSIGGDERAVDNAGSVLGAERALGIDWEAPIQDWFLGHGWLASTANAFYLFAHWPLIAIVAVWLFRRVPDGFRVLRDAMYLSAAAAFVVFAVVPVAPPRLSVPALSDTLVGRVGGAHDVLQPTRFMNEFAAMPSLHLAWNLLLGLVIMRFARAQWVRLTGAAIPILMSVAVVATANHFVLDVVGGVVVALGGWWGARMLAGRAGRPV